MCLQRADWNRETMFPDPGVNRAAVKIPWPRSILIFPLENRLWYIKLLYGRAMLGNKNICGEPQLGRKEWIRRAPHFFNLCSRAP